MKNNKSLSLVCLVICLWAFPYLSTAQTITVSGEINQDTTWSGTVNVVGDVILRDGNSLTIEPGTTVEFQGQYFLKIYGDLQAVGEEGDSILFTASNPTTGWNGIRFNNTTWGGGEYPGALTNNDTSRLSYCRLEYTRSYPAVYMRYFAKMKFEHCFFYQNQNSDDGNAITALQGGGLISDCRFQDNTGTNRDGGALYSGSSLDTFIVKNCTFLGNSNENGGGIYLVSSYAILENNTFISNEASSDGGAVVVFNSDDVIVRNNLMANNEASNGGGIFFSGSSITLLNNTIANNFASTEGGGLYFEANSDASHYSDVIWGNQRTSGANQVYIDDDRSDPSFRHCDIQGGSASMTLSPGIQLTGVYENNILDDPEFILPSPGTGAGSGSLSYDWGLQPVSPCINAGLTVIPGIEITEYDIADNRRVAFGDIDIGAYEYYLAEMSAGGTISQNTVWAADTIRVTGDVTVNNGYTLSVLPDVYVEFQENNAMNIQGTLLARGKEGHPVIFTVKDTAGYATGFTHTAWKGIRFDNTPESNEQSRIEYTILEYGVNVYGGALYVNNFSKLAITNCIFRYNYGSTYGGAAYCYDAGVVFNGCRILENHAYYYGGGVYGWNSDVTIRNSFITDNYASEGGGIYGTVGCIFILDHSSISNNNAILDNDLRRGGAICTQEFCDYYILNSVIANNTCTGDAGAIWIWGGSITAVNSLIVNNLSDSSFTGGIYAVAGAEVNFYNSIIRGNMDYYYNTQVSGDMNIHYSNIEQSGSFGPGNINVDPEFILPTAGAGSAYDAMDADWGLSDFSPCINSGTNEITGTDFPETDLDGNPRINQGIVDMGVYEHQGNLPEITYQPDNLILCEGSQAVFQVQTNDTVRFQWQKDGSNIPGATSGQLSMDSITMANQGNYRCVVSNAYDTILSNPAYLFVVQTPKILDEPEDTWVGKSGQTELRAYASGNNLSYQWMKNGSHIPGAILPYYLLSVTDSTEEGQYACIISNTCSVDITTPATVYLAPQICMVTVDPVTGSNLVVWERKSAAPIQNYNIYRESKYAGIYDLLSSVPYDDLTVFTDSTADPTVQAYLYKITATDTSGYKTDPDLCKTHKTIHLLATKNPETNSTQLDWDNYVGFEYGTYEIYRSDTIFNFTSIHLMSSSTSTWADADPGTGTKYYRVAAVRPDTCFPFSPTKAGTGPYNHSLSNLDDNRLQGTLIPDISGNHEVRIYPNPMEELATIQFPNPSSENFQFSVIDPSGRRVYFLEKITTGKVEFFRDGLPSGLYLYELRGPRIYRGKIIIR